MNTHEILKAARVKIADLANWCQEAPARDKHGKEVFADSPDACQWCAIGAIDAVNLSDRASRYARRQLGRSLHKRAKAAGSFSGVADFNDRSTHAEVLALFDAAIETANKAIT